MKTYWIVDLYVYDNFTSCLGRMVAGVHETKRVFRAVGNSFDVVFAPEVRVEGGHIERDPTLSIRKLTIEGIPQGKKC